MKLEIRTLNERAYDEIREGLIAGRFTPGQTLVIRTLATSYGISITPVRDALQRLVAERLLEVLPNRSIVVPQLKPETFLELARIRTLLEGLAGELATPNLTTAHLQSLKQLLASAQRAIKADDAPLYARLNQQFHFTLYDQCGSPVLLRMITDLWSQVGPFFAHLLHSEAYGDIANDQHRAIIDAAAAGDAAGVKKHIVLDIQSAAVSLTRPVDAENPAAAAPRRVATRRAVVAKRR